MFLTRVSVLVLTLTTSLLLCASEARAQAPASRVQSPGTAQQDGNPVLITLPQAQAKAAGSPLSRAAQLQVEAAKYHREAATADYFPKIDSLFANLHFNKFMGDQFQIIRRNIAIPLLAKDQTIFGITATQPVTPLLKVRQVVELAKADEKIAQAKARSAVTQVSTHVEQAYFALLIAQLQQGVAESKLQVLREQTQIASAGAPPAVVSVEHQAALLVAEKELVEARDKVADLTPSLNMLIGYPSDTRLELVSPELLEAQSISLTQATAQALGNNVEIVEAEQGLAKARAAAKLSKLDYIPDVAVVGSYYYQTAIPSLPNDFTFIGVVATYDVFDFGKREKTIKERNAIVELAQMNVQAVKSKVSTTVQKAWYEVDRVSLRRDDSRQRLLDTQSRTAGRQDISYSDRAASFRAELALIQAELDYRLACLQLKQVIGNE